jgi:hypothetical protein
MRILLHIGLILGLLAMPLRAAAQGVMSDLIAGQLLRPEPGVFAWYQLIDQATGTKYFLRQAIVGAEKVKKKQGYWLETQVQPETGYGVVYKMLLTGPATDPANIHKIIMQEGTQPPQELDIDPKARPESALASGEQRLVGNEEIATPQGTLVCQHFTVDGEKGPTDLWLNDSVRPMGVVRLRSPEGELMLQRFGQGGADGESVIQLKPVDQPSLGPSGGSRTEIRTRPATGGPNKNFSGRKEPGK